MHHVRTQAFCFLYQTHTTFCLFYHVVLCVFSLGLIPSFLVFSAHLFSFPSISFDFPYSIKLWFFLEYWNLFRISFSVFMLDGLLYLLWYFFMHPIYSHHNTTFFLKLTESNISLWCYFLDRFLFKYFQEYVVQWLPA
jgi:hypothetical protein